MSRNLWLGIKFLETSLENSIQLLLMTWLLVHYFACLPVKEWSELFVEGMKGLGSILSFNRYDPGDLAIKCGKIVFAVLSISASSSLVRLGKPGLNFSRKMKSFLVLFPGALCQLIARLISVWVLMMMEGNGWLKYSLFLVAHTTLCFDFKILFEKNQEIRSVKSKRSCLGNPLNWLNKLKRPIMMFINCFCCIFIQNNVRTSQAYQDPKFEIISRSLFLLLVLTENIFMCSLPFIFPHLYNNKSKKLL